MNKTKALRIALILLPLLVTAIAVSPATVTVIEGDTIYTTSFMDPIEESNVGWCAPVGALLNYALFGLSVIYNITRKESWLKGIFTIAFAAMFLTVLPILMEGTPRIIPNVFPAILLGGQCLLSRILMKAEAGQEDKVENRLTNR